MEAEDDGGGGLDGNGVDGGRGEGGIDGGMDLSGRMSVSRSVTYQFFCKVMWKKVTSHLGA